MRLYYFCCATRLLATRPVQSGVHNVLHAVVPPVSGNQWLVWSRLGGQTGRSYSQTNVRKPSLGSEKADTSKPISAPVTPPGRGPDTNPRENRDHLTRLSPPVQDQQKYQPSGSNAYSPPSGGGNLPGDSGGGSLFPNSNPLMGAALTTIVGLGMVFVGGIAYIGWYKKNVLDKMEKAFAPGYDPALELATHPIKQQQEVKEELDELTFNIGGTQPTTSDGHLRRREQDWIERIVHGAKTGHYYVLLGPKGSGKATMIFDAMQLNQAEGVAVCDAHPNLDVFRLRLGRALNYEYNEDSQTGLFQRRDPKEGGAALDIERALNKLEKVALRSSRRTGRPLVLILNNVHFFKNDDEGRNMLLQLQQRAEGWAESGILTLVFSTDDFWPFFLMRQSASRMHVLSIYDLNKTESVHALTRMRKVAPDQEKGIRENIMEAVSIVGGRLLYLSKVSKARDMAEMARHMLSVEKAWLMSQIGLIPDCDDDVMDEQKWSSCSWLLLREFVKIRREQERAREEAGESGEDRPDLPLPAIPYWRCRQIMTRTDFLEAMDRANIIAIDIHHDVRPDNMLILHAARQVVEEEGFDEMLDNVRARIDEIESLHRTSEVTFKDVNKGDRIRLSVDKGGSLLVED